MFLRIFIKFSEVVIPFENLAIGTVIDNGKGRRYMKVALTNYGCWVPSRPTTKGSLTNAEMLKYIGDSAGWKVLP